jgi:hypothetical protein
MRERSVSDDEIVILKNGKPPRWLLRVSGVMLEGQSYFDGRVERFSLHIPLDKPHGKIGSGLTVWADHRFLSHRAAEATPGYARWSIQREKAIVRSVNKMARLVQSNLSLNVLRYYLLTWFLASFGKKPLGNP